jgi:LysM repeat protein
LTEAAPPARDRVCPYLGVVDDPATHYAFPSSAQRCHSDGRPFAIDLAKQSKDCLTAQHVTCPRFHPVANRPVRAGALRDAIAVTATTASLERVEPGTSARVATTLAGGPWPRASRSRRLAKILVVAVLAIVAGLGGLQLGSWVAAQSGGSQVTPIPSGASLSAARLASAPPASVSAVPTGTPSPTASSPQASPGSSPSGTPAGGVEGVTAPPPTHVPQDLVYVVKRGDTLTAIAGRYGVSVEAVKRLNRLKDPNLIFIGQHIRVPRP